MPEYSEGKELFVLKATHFPDKWEMTEGNIEQVHDLLPFLRNKNADIDMAMQIKLSLRWMFMYY